MKIFMRVTAFLCCAVMLLSACANQNANTPVDEPEVTTEPTVTTTAEETTTEATTTTEAAVTTEATTTMVTTATEATTTTEATTAPPVTTTEATTTTSKWKITDTNEKLYATADLNVRATPEQNGERISHVDKGDLVEVTGWVDNGWARIKFRGEEYYVNGKYLSEEKPVEVTTAVTTTAATTADDLSKINEYRPDYDYRTCKNLSGDVHVFVFYMKDSESMWTENEMSKFTKNEILPGLEFLEKEAKKYGVELNFILEETYSDVKYDDDVIISVRNTGLATVDVLYQAAKHIGYTSDEEMLADLQNTYGPEIVCFTVFNKNGTSYAINPKRGYEIDVEEHCILFSHDLNSNHTEPSGSQASIVAHEMLHLYGAEDFYATSGRKALAEAYYSNDLMLSCGYYISKNKIGEATAFYIGWTDKIPDVLYAKNWN